MAIKITVDGNTYEGVDVITVGGKVLTLAYVEDSTGGDAGGDSGGTTAKTYTITNNLTNCTNSNKATSVQEGTAYSGAITPDSGYELQSVTVTMGGSPVSVSSGIFGIPAVTGNIIITAVAVEITDGGGDGGEVENNGWVDGQPYEIEWTEGYSIDTATGADKETSGCWASNYLPCHGASAVYMGTGLYQNYGVMFYDESKNFLVSIGSGTYGGYDTPSVPLNAYYVRCYTAKADKTAATLTPLVYPKLTETSMYEVGTRYSLDWEYGITLNANTGAESEQTNDADETVSKYAFCMGASTVTVSSKVRHPICFYDSDKNFISSVMFGISTAVANIPDNAAYFRIDTYGYSDSHNEYVTLA